MSRAEKKVAVKAAKKERQALKAQKALRKKNAIEEEDDIETLVREAQKKTAAAAVKVAGKLLPCDQPSPRAACSFTPLGGGDFLLFGGEFYEGSKVVIYGDTFRFSPHRKEWRRVESAGPSPAPRCAHQATWAKDAVFVFGGEFATVHQFHHFRDLWKFDPKTNSWTEVETSGSGPSARSGHRMVEFKNNLIIFGGFHDTVREKRYFNDLYVLNLTSLRWAKISLSSAYSVAPEPRSGVLMGSFPQQDFILVAGGYRKTKDSDRSTQGGALRDAWGLDMKRVLQAACAKGGVALQSPWMRLGAKAALPTVRAGVSCAIHKGNLICFGGVSDEDDGGLGLRSMYYNDLWAFDMTRKKWHPLKLKAKQNAKVKKKKKKIEAEEEDKTNEKEEKEDEEKVEETEEEKEEEEFRWSDDDEDIFAYVDHHGKLVRIKIEKEEEPTKEPETGSEGTCLMVNDVGREEKAEEEEEEEEKAEEGEDNQLTDLRNLIEDKTTPLPRLNACLGIHGANELIVYGGLVELGKQEFTLDDCWSLNLSTRESWKSILPGHLESHPWNEVEEDERSSESEEVSSDEDKGEEDEGEEDENIAEQIPQLRAQLGDAPEASTPLPGEVLKDFFARTKIHWMTEASLQCTDEKEVRRQGFILAEKRFKEIYPILEKMQKLQTKLDAAAESHKHS